MFFFKFPNLGPEKTLLIFSTFSLAHSLIVLFMIFHWDYPAIAPTLVRFPSLYYIFRMFVTSMMVLYVPTILIPVGGALGVYKPHPAMSMPFTVLNIIDLLISFGYTIAYLPFLLLRVLGNDFDDPVTLNSIIVSVVIFALKLLFQVCVYSTVHKAVEEMTNIDDSSPFSLDSIHTGINILTCCAEKMYDLDLLAIGLETTRTDDDVENQNVSKPEGEEKTKRAGFQIKRLKVVQEPNKPVTYVHHPVNFETASELGSIYNKFKERAKERFDMPSYSSARNFAQGAGLPDVNKPIPQRNFIPTYHKQTWKQAPGGFKPASNVQAI